MRFNHRSPGHWIAVVVIVVLGLFTFNYARGQGVQETVQALV